MMRINHWMCLSWVSFLSLVLGPASVSVVAADRPNVVVIAADDLNNWVGCMGGIAKTPNIDRLAARGTLFTNAHCQATLCNSSRTSLMTGLRPTTTGIYALQPWIRNVTGFKDIVTLPQHFKQNGYRTLNTGKLYHNSLPPPQHRELDFDEIGPVATYGKPLEKKLVQAEDLPHPLLDWGVYPYGDEETGDWQTASWAVEKINEKPQEPFFMGVGFFFPHVPCFATQKWFDLYPADMDVMPVVPTFDRDDIPDFAWYLHWKLPEPRLSWLEKNNQWENLVRSYLASASFMDSQVGRVLDALEANDLMDNTIIVFWSDHGWHLGEKGMTGKTTLWRESTNVPFIFAGPGIASGAVCDQPVELLDLYPTLSELCGLAPNTSNEGHSLVPQLHEAATPRQWPAITTECQGNHSIVDQKWRYIRYADGSEELYHFVKDPNEWNNLANDPRYASVKAALAEWLPENEAEPAPGSRHRLLSFENGVWHWEREPIDPEDRQQ